jgi:putative addiction module component (TIGR02574 family)
MSLTRAQLKSEAMKLDAIERETLAEELLLSIDDVGRAEIDAAWLDEVRNRASAFQSGTVTAKPVDDVIARLKAKTQQ